jgi:hypothetical protein
VNREEFINIVNKIIKNKICLVNIHLDPSFLNLFHSSSKPKDTSTLTVENLPIPFFKNIYLFFLDHCIKSILLDPSLNLKIKYIRNNTEIIIIIKNNENTPCTHGCMTFCHGNKSATTNVVPPHKGVMLMEKIKNKIIEIIKKEMLLN